MKHRLLSSLGVIFALLCLICIVFAIKSFVPDDKPEPINTSAVSQSEKTTQPVTETYKSPIDFEEIKKDAPDVIAWLEAEGTGISYPVVFRENDNSYYLRRDIHGNYSNGGSLFIENYNKPDFDDPVTVIYGHNLKSGAMFAPLQKIYTNPETFSEHQNLTVYLPDKELHYRVFCGVPLDNSHILYYHNFKNSDVFENFFSDAFNTRSLLAVRDENIEIHPDDKVVMLSTCLTNDKTKRYVVMAVLTDQ